MDELLRHCQTRGTATDRLTLNYYASSLLYPGGFEPHLTLDIIGFAKALEQK